MWPRKAPSPPAMATSGPPIRLPIRTLAVPLSASSRSVTAASSLRPVLKTLVAPMLPEPMLRMSPSPASRVSRRPKGMEPRPYPIASARISSAVVSVIGRCSQKCYGGLSTPLRFRVPMHRFAFNHREQNTALHRALVERRVLGACTHKLTVNEPSLIDVEQHQVCRCAFRESSRGQTQQPRRIDRHSA